MLARRRSSWPELSERVLHLLGGLIAGALGAPACLLSLLAGLPSLLAGLLRLSACLHALLARLPRALPGPPGDPGGDTRAHRRTLRSPRPALGLGGHRTR
jgi:hypothetical protein